MKLKLLLILTTTLVCFQFSYAQKKYFQKGYIVTNNSDTLNGYIRHLEHSTLMDGIDFKNTLEDTISAKHFLPSDIKCFFLIKDNLMFEPVIYTSPDERIVITKFGNLLVSSNLNLYRLNMIDTNNTKIFEEDNDHIYVVKKGKDFTVLRITEQIKNEIYTVNKDYRKQLKKLFGISTEGNSSIDKLLFDDKSMIQIFTSDIDNNSNKLSTKTIIHTNKNKTIFKNIITFGDVSFINNGKNYGNGYIISYLLNLFRPQELGRLSLITGIEYAKYNGEVVSGINTPFIRFPVFASYSLAKGSFEPFINFGVTPFLYSPYNLLYFNTNLGIGTYYKDRFYISVLYEYTPLLNQSGDNISISNILNSYSIYTKIGIKLF